jgi:hypothetical protein
VSGVRSNLAPASPGHRHAQTSRLAGWLVLWFGIALALSILVG